MSMELSEIKTLNSVDLENFEIRGFKYGIGNASTTGPAYADGTYIPARNIVDATAFFVSDSSIVTSFSLAAPYASLDASSLKINDTIGYDTSNFTVTELLSSSSFEIDMDSGIDGTKLVSVTMNPRDYLVEPDKINNTYPAGDATFTNGSITVNGVGTDWSGNLQEDDFIKSDAFQLYYRINNVIDDTTLELASAYGGDTTVCSYIAKKRKLNQMYIRYTKDNFTYEKNGGFWEVTDATTASEILATDYFSPLADGIETKFTPTIKASDPDLMDTNAVTNKVLTQETINPLFQYALPEVPNPESSFELKINDILKDRFPNGNMDYVISYHADPIYLPPPPVAERKVANLMFLEPVSGSPSPSTTETGFISFTDAEGNEVGGVMPGSETITLDGTNLTLYEDYVVDGDAGTLSITEPILDESVVKYVHVDRNEFFDYGLSFHLNGRKLQYSIPPQDTDEVKFILSTGKMRPADKSHPAPGEEYIIDYYVETATISDEVITVTPGLQNFQVNYYPVANDSVIVMINGSVIDEFDDYRVDYYTGRIILNQALTGDESLSVSYTPLSRHKNGMSYLNGTSYCTVYDSRLTVKNAPGFEFGLVNYTLNPQDITIHRIYNDTRNKDYDITGYIAGSNYIKLLNNITNQSIGLAATDIVIIDYTLESETTEYYPVVTINTTIPENSNEIYVSGLDATASFIPGSVVSLSPSNASMNYAFIVNSSSYDGEETKIDFLGYTPADIINISAFSSDASVSFSTLPFSASNIVSDSNQVKFSGSNRSYLFRQNQLLKIKNDAYIITGSQYDSENEETVISLSADIVQDYTSSSILSSIGLSDSPLYYEGDTVLSTAYPVVQDPAQPALLLEYPVTGDLLISSDSSSLYVDDDSTTLEFPYVDYPTIGDMSSVLDSSVSGIQITDYVPAWPSSKIVQVTNQNLSNESSVLLSVSPALRLDGTDTTSFTVSLAGNIILDNPIEEFQRYNLDYQGLEFIGTQQVDYTVSQFVALPVGSKITASFEYDNLDQFYLQVMSQRYFLENVTEPRMEQEAQQNNGNVGQGGDFPGDEAAGNSEGGLTDDEYERKDTEIECRIFNNIFDFFNGRLQAFSDELYAETGLRICNNDGLLSEYEQSMATKTYNRMWPYADYIELKPYPITCLTGQTRRPGYAVFTNGDSTVTGVLSDTGTPIWSQQVTSGDFIRPWDSTKDYTIDTVVDNTTIVLSTNYDGANSPTSGEEFILTSNLPLYDDDGHVGAKIVGTKSGGFDLEDGDIFDVYVDGTYQSYEFKDPSPPPLIIPLIFGVDRLSADDIARILTSEIDNLDVTYEWTFDASTTFGYKNVFVLRTDGGANCITMGDGTAVSKLGFTPGDYDCGNLDRTSSAEIFLLDQEGQLLGEELTLLGTVISNGSTNKLDRVSPANIGDVQDVYDKVYEESLIYPDLINILNDEIDALEIILQEPTLPAYTQSLIAYGDATDFLASTLTTQAYANSILTNWEGKIDGTAWALDLEGRTQYVRGIDATGVAVDTSSGGDTTSIWGQTEFILDATGGYDTRILNDNPVIFDGPDVFYEDNDEPVDGTWSGWDSGVSDYYSVNNQITFYSNDATPAFFINFEDGAGYTTNAVRFRLDWSSNTSSSDYANFEYATYPTLGALINGISDMDGFEARLNHSANGYDYTNLRADSSVSIPGSPGTNVYLGTQSPALSVYSSLSSPEYIIDSTAIALLWMDGTDQLSETLMFSAYPTLGSLESKINTFSGFIATNYYDPAYSYSTLDQTSGDLSSSAPGSTIFFDSSSPVAAFRVFFEMDNLRYSVDTTSISLLWEEDSTTITKYYPYSTYTTIGSIKTAIDSIPGIDATGNELIDSSGSSLKIDSGFINTDATIFRGFRDMYINYHTISDQILSDRTSFVTDRSSEVSDRYDYLLNTRESQIKQHITQEETLRSSDGSPGNLYNWANNRFNRSGGCEARLKQIEQRIAVREENLEINQGLT